MLLINVAVCRESRPGTLFTIEGEVGRQIHRNGGGSRSSIVPIARIACDEIVLAGTNCVALKVVVVWTVPPEEVPLKRKPVPSAGPPHRW